MTGIQMVSDAERREAWLAERRQVITATDAAKILGVSPWGGPIDVYMEKVGIGDEKPATAAMRRGKRRERLVLDMYAEEEGVELKFADPYRLFTSLSLPIGCTLDARRSDDGRPVEAKTARYKGSEWGEHGTDTVPIWYATQQAIQMAVLDTPINDMPVEFTGEDYVCYRLHRDATTEKRLLDLLVDFKTQYIDARVAPPPDGSEGYKNFLGSLYAKHSERIVVATPPIALVARELAARKERIKADEFAARECEAEIKTFMQDAHRCEGDGWNALWKTNKDTAKVDWKGVADALASRFGEKFELDSQYGYPAMISSYTQTTPGARPFRFTVKEGGQ